MRERAFTHKDARSERATAVIHLCLGQIERILALDIARAHVIADGVAVDAALWADDESELRFRHGPMGVAPDPNFAPRTDCTAGRRFEEEFRAFGGIDAIVEVAATCVFRFFHACAATAIVGDAGSPHLLMA